MAGTARGSHVGGELCQRPRALRGIPGDVVESRAVPLSALPVALHGEHIRALVVGGGEAGTRKALALVEAGARVRVIAPHVTAALAVAEQHSRVEIAREAYRSEALGDESLVFAATDSREVNLRVAADARIRGKLVNVADAPAEGDFDTMAIHRSGDVTIAVSAGGVPGAAARIRDAIGARFDVRYDRAISALRELRSRLLARGGEDWRTASPALLGEDFCDAVESGTFADRVTAWR